MHEVTIHEQPEVFLSWLEQKAIAEFPFRAAVERHQSVVGGPRNTVKVYTTRGMLPRTGLGWFFNLFMLAITLGAWIAPYLLWALFAMDEDVDAVTVTALPTGPTESRIVADGNNPEWFAIVVEWLDQRRDSRPQ